MRRVLILVSLCASAVTSFAQTQPPDQTRQSEQ